MDFFATMDFRLMGASVETGDELSETFDRRTIGHLLVAGWATAIPSAA